MIAQPQHNSGMAEQNLLHRAQEGEAEAFDRLFHAHKDGVYACLWHLLGAEGDVVEEAVGSVFLNAYRALGRFRGDSSFSTWLYRIAVNEAHARIRQRRRARMFGWLSLSDCAVAGGESGRQEDPAHTVMRSEEERRLRRAVQALPEPYRTPVILRYINAMTAADIAEILKRPAGTVRYQLSRALQILRERLGNDQAT